MYDDNKLNKYKKGDTAILRKILIKYLSDRFIDNKIFKKEIKSLYFDFGDYDIIKKYYLMKEKEQELIPKYIKSLEYAIKYEENKSNKQSIKNALKLGTAELNKFFTTQIKKLLQTNNDNIACTAMIFKEAPEDWEPDRTKGDRYAVRKIIREDGELIKIKYIQITKPTIYHVDDNIINEYDTKQCYENIIYKLVENKNRIVLNENENKKYAYMSVNFIKLLIILGNDEDFDLDWYMNDYKRSYFDMITIFNVNLESKTFNKSMKFEDMVLHQSIDNNAICFKYIDYALNPNAKAFCDLFQFEEASNKILSNLKANSCYLTLLIATFKDQIEKKQKKTDIDITKMI